MRVDSHPAVHRDDTAAPSTPSTPQHGPLARIIAGSVAAGAVTALVLTLVVFAGGTESVITGSVLTAFGLGWALIAALTTRYTDRPQRWAALPAFALGGTGLGLLFLTPGTATLTWLSWGWPPLVLAATVWMLVQMRRSLTGRGRWLLTPVVAVLGITAIGATFENITLHHDQDTYAAPGTTYDVGGHRMHLDCEGHGGPTVVLLNGLGEVSASWARVVGEVGRDTRVCAYDRPGQGWSEEAGTPQDGVAAAADLHALLAVAGEHGPYVLVGHSIGGPYALTYAHRYPEQVAGMVLLDSSSPRQETIIPSFAGQYALMRRVLPLLPVVNRLGLGRLLAPASHLPAPAADQVRALTTTPQAASNGRDEQANLPEIFQQAQALTTLNGRPLAVVTASENVEMAGWAAAQDELAALSDNHVHWVADATHGGLLEDRAGSAESVRAITAVVSAARSGSPVNPK